ncbi:hypothetical protein MKJ04_02810 [Pontibacter sp. E15-1]|uniref:hypothetical protein n=1 Tax=Pontibacter sp. E15-1 TaxID=2919918 RepID=UPI001F4F2259|nr:hypothetical protein [Pontibacter sp. E15-1]MCJ8163755.1 hypothetical protein [Pontibacter sp. E15-1]
MYDPDPHASSGEALLIVAHNPRYELLYDYSTNRVYLTVKGFWKNPEIVPQYLDDVQKALRMAKTGFSLLLDLRTMLTHPLRLSSLHIKARNMMQEAGPGKAAQVFPSDRIATLQVEEISGKTTLEAMTFTSIQKAKAWLNA